MIDFGNIEGSDNPEQRKSSKIEEKPDTSSKENKKKLVTTYQEMTSDKKSPSELQGMTDREKYNYYRKNGLESLANNRASILRSNEGNTENYRLTKMNSHNMDKLAQARNLAPDKAQELKKSFAKFSPDANPNSENYDPSLRKHRVYTRHAPKGEKMHITGNKPGSGDPPTGIYVAKGFPKTEDKRKNDYALPTKNKADMVKSVELARAQNIIIGQTGPQEGEFFGGKKSGGGRQIITDGGIEGRDVNGDGKKEPALRYRDSSDDPAKSKKS